MSFNTHYNVYNSTTATNKQKHNADICKKSKKEKYNNKEILFIEYKYRYKINNKKKLYIVS